MTFFYHPYYHQVLRLSNDSLTADQKAQWPNMTDGDVTRPRLQTFVGKPRVFILSDISNEPDDAESLVRYLTYANQFRTEGLVPVTSIWLKDRTCPEDMHKIMDGYAAAAKNLNLHTHSDFPYPAAEDLRSLIRPGAPVSIHFL